MPPQGARSVWTPIAVARKTRPDRVTDPFVSLTTMSGNPRPIRPPVDTVGPVCLAHDPAMFLGARKTGGPIRPPLSPSAAPRSVEKAEPGAKTRVRA